LLVKNKRFSQVHLRDRPRSQTKSQGFSPFKKTLRSNPVIVLFTCSFDIMDWMPSLEGRIYTNGGDLPCSSFRYWQHFFHQRPLCLYLPQYPPPSKGPPLIRLLAPGSMGIFGLEIFLTFFLLKMDPPPSNGPPHNRTFWPILGRSSGVMDRGGMF